MIKQYLAIFAAILLATAAGTSLAYEAEDSADCVAQTDYYIFSWPLGRGCNDRPRGGTSTGAPVTLASDPHPGWLAIQEPELSAFERDRRAILAMSGPYKVNFDFLETVGFSEDFRRDRPYQSWGTEYVYVLEDRGEFISLQHLMVMYFQQDDGTVSAPMVMKHWRQDWTYQDDELLEFDHANQWRKQKLRRRDRAGTWSQAVYQVDDSPRYESSGRWVHNASFSSWRSGLTRRPLPRREASVRDDYAVLEGYNRHTITRGGWVQAEENWKLALTDAGKPDPTTPYLAKEEGMGRYQRVADVDFTAGDQYMALAGQFWQDVRTVWQEIISEREILALHEEVDGQPLYVPLFQYAEKVMQAGEYDAEAGKAFADQTIRAYVKP